MAKTVSTGMNLAAREHMAGGNPLTRLEALVLFGVSNLPELVYEMKKEGYVMHSKKIAYAAAVVRLNASNHAVLKPPPNLPIREIQLTEYWVSR